MNNLTHCKSTYLKDIDKLVNHINYLRNKIIEDAANTNASCELLKDNSLEEPVLVWRYFQNYCNSCIDYELIILKENIKKINEKNIVIIATYDNPLIMNTWIATNRLKRITLLKVPADEFNFNSENNYHEPYFFIYNKEKIANFIFTPEESLPQLTEKYFNRITEEYFQH